MEIAVLGAGTMGHGIAHVSAMAGHSVMVRDIDEERVDQGIAAVRENLEQGVDLGKVDTDRAEVAMAAIDGTVDLAECVRGADIVIEAVPEDLGLKRETFAEVEPLVDGETIIATNTSSISVTAIASALDDASRAIGLHFFNPPHLMELVEIVVAEQTATATADDAERYVDSIDKRAAVVDDAPGFATSRLGAAIGCEAMRMLQEGVADAADIDRAMRLGYNHPMGPLELTDHVGLDVRLGVLENLREELGERFRPPEILRRKARAGKLGKKTGEGFYRWNGDEKVPTGEERR